MKRIIFTLVLIALIFTALDANGVGLLTAAKGKVNLRRGGKNVSFKVGDSLNNQDEIRTRSQSFAAYKYVDNSTTIKVFANSYVLVNASRKDRNLDKNVKVFSGSVFTKVDPKSKGSMKVSTPTTVASVKGTEFLTSVNNDGEVTYIVTKGTVNVEIPDTGENSDVTEGQTAIVDKDLTMSIRDTTEEDLQTLATAEEGSLDDHTPNILRIPMVDKDGNTKIIEIEY